MNQTNWLQVLAGTLTLVCVVPYLRDIVRGRTRPQRASWLIFTALAGVAAISQFMTGSTVGAFLALGAALGFALVFIASLWRGEGGLTGRDLLAMTIGLAGVIGSVVVREPLVALASVIGAELAAVVLTVRKALRAPETETASTWAIDACAGLVALAAIPAWTVEQWLYPAYHLLANLAVLLAILQGRRVGARAVCAPAA